MWSSLNAVLRRDVFLYVVCFTGAVILAVEVMAVRILAPYFGNTIYTFSSVISVILGALSVGYWHGGKLADRTPKPHRLYQLVTYAGWSVLSVQILNLFTLPFLSAGLSLTTGPLISAGVLFFIPSYFFGVLSPFVIRLRSDQLPNMGAGAVSGQVFFFSTVGSIAGSLLSGFVLVPYVGITYSMVTLGALTVMLGSIGEFQTRSLPPSWIHMFHVIGIRLFILCAFFWLAHVMVRTPMLPVPPGSTVLHVEDGVYERVAVADIPAYAGMQRGRVLVLDRTFSSGVTLPYGDLLFPYTKYYKLYSHFNETPERMLVLGAGTGTYAKALHETYPTTTIDMVDIEPRLIELASEYFGMPRTPYIQGHTADGRQFLRRHDTQYSFVLGDMYSQMYAVPWHVSTYEYYALLRERLAPGGVYIENHVGSLAEVPSSPFWSSVRTLHEVFGEVRIFGVTSPTFDGQQNIMLVVRKDAPLDVLDTLSTSSDTELREFANQMVAYAPEQLASYPIYTDDLAPVELYSARMTAERLQ
jgi:spermidine synthase